MREQLAARMRWSTTAAHTLPRPSRARRAILQPVYDVDRRLVRMKQNFDYWHHCPQCDKNFESSQLPRDEDPIA